MRMSSQESMCRRRDSSPINTRCESGVPEPIERSWCSIREPQSIDMNALREEIMEMISATLKEKLCSDADSVTTVSQSILALDANAQYWSNLSNKAARRSRRALELQLKLAEEKVNTLLHREAPEENTQLCEAGLMPEQQVRFCADTGRYVTSPSRNYGLNSINEVHIPRAEADALFAGQSTPALSMTAQLDGAVVNMTSEYSGIQQMARQAIQNASPEEEPEKSFLAKAGVKVGNPPTYSGEHNLKKFENWVASVLQYMSMYNLLGPRAGKVQLGQCLTDEAQEWFYWQKWFMPMLSLNKVAVNYDRITQGSMTMQQLHQELTKLAKQMIELPDAYSYRRRFMSALKNKIRDQVLKNGLTPEFSKIDELIEEAVKLDNAKHYTSGYNSNYGSSYLHKTAAVEHSHAQHTTTQNRSSNPNAGSSNQHKSGSNTVQNRLTTQLLLTGRGNVRANPTYTILLGLLQKQTTMLSALIATNQVIFDQTVPFLTRIGELQEQEQKKLFLRKMKVKLKNLTSMLLTGEIRWSPDTHPEEQQEYEDQPEEDDQQYRFDDEEYKTRSIDNEVVYVNAVIKASGYNDHRRLYGIRVREAETDLRISAVLQTGVKEQPVYDH
ncbi:hypothetical protein M422DRAFT_270268 [Sphaerobolus stellatus SS14]|uniref:Uncharacterized protein n=1 Tax=Sphaerobolus stellatus (strain SS14) TaxID=990650 RepID=A0A0C9UTD7_SPHS4|nr:hypothetical protein M422DRAFT_270268 [Sphaerobolus stellatus SS14]